MITEKKTQFLADELDQLRRQGLFRPLRVLGSAQDTEVIVDGKRVLNLSSNNYLGLTTHPRLKTAMIETTVAVAGSLPRISFAAFTKSCGFTAKTT